MKRKGPQVEMVKVQVKKAIRLRYVPAGLKGYLRIRKGKGFTYQDMDGRIVKDNAVLARIRSLVLPPAWNDVWICPWPEGHLQATGIDSKGRKQYRYHAGWNSIRSEKKFDRMLDFGKELPIIREKIRQDLGRDTLDRNKVIAIALRTIEETAMRVGNVAYERENGSHGLTTLHNNHVKIKGGAAFFRFRGKKGVMQKIELRQASLVKLLQQMRDIPGQELFQYYDEEGAHQSLDSGEINEYLKGAGQEEFTCKDFRTWIGSVHALRLMAGMPVPDPATAGSQQLTQIVNGVAEKLGNTAAVCKKYYIHPRLLEAFEADSLKPYLRRMERLPGQGGAGAMVNEVKANEIRANEGKANGESSGLHPDEKIFLDFLRKETASAQERNGSGAFRKL